MKKTFYYVIHKDSGRFYVSLVEENFFKQHGYMADVVDKDKEFSDSFHYLLAEHGLIRHEECVFEFSGSKEALDATLKKLPFLKWDETFQHFMNRVGGN